MSIKLSINITTANLQLFTLNTIDITVKLLIIIIYLNTVNATEVKIGITFNNYNYVIELKDLSLDALKVVINIT